MEQFSQSTQKDKSERSRRRVLATLYAAFRLKILPAQYSCGIAQPQTEWQRTCGTTLCAPSSSFNIASFLRLMSFFERFFLPANSGTSRLSSPFSASGTLGLEGGSSDDKSAISVSGAVKFLDDCAKCKGEQEFVNFHARPFALKQRQAIAKQIANSHFDNEKTKHFNLLRPNTLTIDSENECDAELEAKAQSHRPRLNSIE